jgi:anti-sigma B factor antagonist
VRAVQGDRLTIELSVGSPLYLTLTGDLDLNTVSELRTCLDAWAHADHIIIDCEQLRFLDSTGVSLLVHTYRTFDDHGQKLELHGVTGIPRRTLEILGLTEAIGIADT